MEFGNSDFEDIHVHACKYLASLKAVHNVFSRQVELLNSQPLVDLMVLDFQFIFGRISSLLLQEVPSYYFRLIPVQIVCLASPVLQLLIYLPRLIRLLLIGTMVVVEFLLGYD